MNKILDTAACLPKVKRRYGEKVTDHEFVTHHTSLLSGPVPERAELCLGELNAK